LLSVQLGYDLNIFAAYCDIDMSVSMPMPMPNLTLPSGLSVPLPSVSLPYMPSAAGTLPAAMPALNLSAVSMSGGVMPLSTAQLDAATAAAAAAAATQRKLLIHWFSLSLLHDNEEGCCMKVDSYIYSTWQK